MERAQTSREIINSIIKFFIRRFFRIYLTTLAFIIIYTIILLIELKSFELFGLLKYLTHFKGQGAQFLWSVSIELQFYAFVPLICFTLLKFNKKNDVTLFLIIPATFLVHAAYYYKVKVKHDEYYDLSEWMLQFLMGSLIAVVYKKSLEHNLSKFVQENKSAKFTICFLCYAMFINGVRFQV
jgi:peptidoglycan/LPS O-acetylase OafA/YrhL